MGTAAKMKSRKVVWRERKKGEREKLPRAVIPNPEVYLGSLGPRFFIINLARVGFSKLQQIILYSDFQSGSSKKKKKITKSINHIGN